VIDSKKRLNIPLFSLFFYTLFEDKNKEREEEEK